MIKYDEIKKYIVEKNNTDNLDNASKIIIILCREFSYTFDSLIIEYLPFNKTNLDEIMRMMKNNYAYLYFRYFYFFYILIKYVYSDMKINNDDLKTVFEYFVQYSGKNSKADNNLRDSIISILINNYEYLHQKFFIAKTSP